MSERSGSIDFYTNPMSRGRIARWMLEECGCPYVSHVLEYGSSMKSPAYLAINPMGKVPAIVHHGVVVTETAAICAYLADAFPAANLAPPLNDAQRGSYLRWLFFAAGPVEAAVTQRGLGIEVPAEKAGMVGYGNFEQMVDTLEKVVAGAMPWLLGDHFTAADVYLGSQVMFGLRFKSLPERPAFVAYAQRLAARDAWKRASALDDADIPAQS